MDFIEARELIRVRYELRRLAAEGRSDEARPLLDRMRALAERDAEEAEAVRPELDRWQYRLGL